MKIGNNIELNNEQNDLKNLVSESIKVTSSVRNIMFIKLNNVYNIIRHEVR